ncbi:class I SAM-dependent methyltransferase [Ktedonobacter racemifer]|uniref:Methyltransferase type 11 n=1 Tax=Ktedonobacter racemifer DSM 44963 TaxID=485913 RepID=D6U364_KTERA|nr:class I SAM-dependent methyltransferase [Ktedonobacter racemifer]EFH81068.1 Methyltransferase type 11 [Ktedonobacter racemifer DSM 44963]
MQFLKRLARRSSPPTHMPTLASPSLERRYRDDVPYLLPKDLEEGDRLNFQHYALRLALKGNFVAPLGEQVQHILDVGSGTGIWGQEMARQFPHAHIVGLDLEPPQTVSLSAAATLPPSNYRFLQGDVLKGLPFSAPTFDLTHQRLLVFAIPAAQWPFVLGELVRVTHSQGWVELLDFDGFYSMGPAMEQADAWLRRSLQARGIQMDIISTLDGILQHEANAQGVQLHQFTKQWLDLPIGGWRSHDRIGPLVEKNILNLFLALKSTICTHLQIEPATYDRVLATLPQEWHQYYTYLRCYLIFSQVLR